MNTLCLRVSLYHIIFAFMGWWNNPTWFGLFAYLLIPSSALPQGLCMCHLLCLGCSPYCVCMVWCHASFWISDVTLSQQSTLITPRKNTLIYQYIFSTSFSQHIRYSYVSIDSLSIHLQSKWLKTDEDFAVFTTTQQIPRTRSSM